MFKQLDIPMCRKVLEFAEGQHSDFIHNQGVFLAVKAKVTTPYSEHPEAWRWTELTGGQTECGTVGCLAGIACHLADVKLVDYATLAGTTTKTPVDDESWAGAGGRVMGLTAMQADDLFWTMDNEDALGRLRGYIEKAEKERADAAT